MPIAIAMPRLGMTMREGRVVEWRAAPGERVAQGQVVLVIESEKAEVEIEAPVAAVLRHVYVGLDETVPCATLLAALTETPDEPFDAEAFRRESQAAAPGPAPDCDCVIARQKWYSVTSASAFECASSARCSGALNL